jgi:hypothetical protein
MAGVSVQRAVTNEFATTEIPLVDIIDRLLDRGVVLAGAATISVAGVDLIELRLNVVLASVDALERSRSRA